MASADAPPALRSANIIPFMHDPAHQAEWQWPELMARRTAVQEPKFYWRGRALGGSSAVNAQIAIRGVPEAFDNWAEAGCEGWSAKDVLPLFDRIEDDADLGTAPGMRRGGPLPVYRTPMERWGAVDRGLWDAALAVGYPWKADLNAPEGEGVSCYPINSRDGQRVTTNDGIWSRRAGGRIWRSAAARWWTACCSMGRARLVCAFGSAMRGKRYAGAGGGAIGGRHPLTGDPDAVGYRGGLGVAGVGDSGGRRSAGRGAEFDGPSGDPGDAGSGRRSTGRRAPMLGIRIAA